MWGCQGSNRGVQGETAAAKAANCRVLWETPNTPSCVTGCKKSPVRTPPEPPLVPHPQSALITKAFFHIIVTKMGKNEWISGRSQRSVASVRTLIMEAS